MVTLLVIGCISYPSSYHPGSAPGLKLQKLSKESGIFQSFGAISFVLFY